MTIVVYRYSWWQRQVSRVVVEADLERVLGRSFATNLLLTWVAEKFCHHAQTITLATACNGLWHMGSESTTNLIAKGIVCLGRGHVVVVASQRYAWMVKFGGQ